MRPFITLIKGMLFLAPLMLLAPAFSQDAKKLLPKLPAANWVVNCNLTKDGASMICAMSQTFNDAKSKKRIMAISIQPQPTDKTKRPLMVLALPHGLHFPSGVTVAVDQQKPINVELQTSNQNGAYTATLLQPATVAAMKKGDQIKITMYAAENKPLVIPVSLVGFTAAFKKINSGQ